MATRLLLASLGLSAAHRVEVVKHEQESEMCPPPRQSFGKKGCFYKCDSDHVVPMAAPAKKGLALDDTTLHWCPENVPFHWPNTDEPVTSFRMFKAWASWWTEPWTSKEKAWGNLAKHLKASKGQVLVGTQISCNEASDDEDWENVKAMAKVFGPNLLMGLAIGNELELLWTKESVLGDILPECLDRMWNKEYFLNKFHSRVREFDALGQGFNKVKVTSVFGGFILAEPGFPFYERTDLENGYARVNTFVKNVTKVFGDRYAHTVNIYPYFEDYFVKFDAPGVQPPTCDKALEFVRCFAHENPDKCNFAWMVKRVRERLEALGNVDATLWIGETGWSHPIAATLDTKMKWCADWSSKESFAEYYMNFLDWDLSMNGKYKGPDHIFYFTMRDSQNFGKKESFGLMGDGDPMKWCVNTTCKIQKSHLLPTPDTTTTTTTTSKPDEKKPTPSTGTTTPKPDKKPKKTKRTTTSKPDKKKPEKKKSEEAGAKWQFVCNGFIHAHLPGREGFGKAKGGNSIETCLDECDAHGKCNSVTFDDGSNSCWMENILAKPIEANCDNNRGGHSYWKGDQVGADEIQQVDHWEFVCNGYIHGDVPGREGFGDAKGATDIDSCQDKCDAHGKCNAVTFDKRGKNCWMERIPEKPYGAVCDGNTGGLTFWRGKGSATPDGSSSSDPDMPPDGKHCAQKCAGYDKCEPQYGPGWCYRKCHRGGEEHWCSSDCVCERKQSNTRKRKR